MKLIDIDNQEMINLPKAAEAFLLKEFPIDDYEEMYDIDGDMVIDEKDYGEVEALLFQNKLIGVFKR